MRTEESFARTLTTKMRGLALIRGEWGRTNDVGGEGKNNKKKKERKEKEKRKRREKKKDETFIRGAANADVDAGVAVG